MRKEKSPRSRFSASSTLFLFLSFIALSSTWQASPLRVERLLESKVGLGLGEQRFRGRHCFVTGESRWSKVVVFDSSFEGVVLLSSSSSISV